jgi:hypothetical protein
MLVECHIVGQDDCLGSGVPEPVALGAQLIPNKRHLDRTQIELLLLVLGHMYVGFTSKYSEI